MPRMRESCLAHERVTSHISMSYSEHMHESRHTHRRTGTSTHNFSRPRSSAISHVTVTQVNMTHVNMTHVKHVRVMSYV